MTILESLGTERTQRDFALDVWGEERVAEDWTTSYWMRSQIRRWIEKAEALDKGGWRSLLQPEAPED